MKKGRFDSGQFAGNHFTRNTSGSKTTLYETVRAHPFGTTGWVSHAKMGSLMMQTVIDHGNNETDEFGRLDLLQVSYVNYYLHKYVYDFIMNLNADSALRDQDFSDNREKYQNQFFMEAMKWFPFGVNYTNCLSETTFSGDEAIILNVARNSQVPVSNIWYNEELKENMFCFLVLQMVENLPNKYELDKTELVPQIPTNLVYSVPRFEYMVSRKSMPDIARLKNKYPHGLLFQVYPIGIVVSSTNRSVDSVDFDDLQKPKENRSENITLFSSRKKLQMQLLIN